MSLINMNRDDIMGVLRSTDSSGRVGIPSELREFLGIGINDRVILGVNGIGQIVIVPLKAVCIYCGDKAFARFRSLAICEHCLTQLKRGEIEEIKEVKVLGAGK